MDRKRKLERISGGYYIVSILDGIEKIRQLSEELNKTGAELESAVKGEEAAAESEAGPVAGPGAR